MCNILLAKTEKFTCSKIKPFIVNVNENLVDDNVVMIYNNYSFKLLKQDKKKDF
jgi:hypothetical protein